MWANEAPGFEEISKNVRKFHKHRLVRLRSLFSFDDQFRLAISVTKTWKDKNNNRKKLGRSRGSKIYADHVTIQCCFFWSDISMVKRALPWTSKPLRTSTPLIVVIEITVKIQRQWINKKLACLLQTVSVTANYTMNPAFSAAWNIRRLESRK